MAGYTAWSTQYNEYDTEYGFRGQGFNGELTYCYTNDPNGSEYRFGMAVKFDFSGIPAGATITSATLYVRKVSYNTHLAARILPTASYWDANTRTSSHPWIWAREMIGNFSGDLLSCNVMGNINDVRNHGVWIFSSSEDSLRVYNTKNASLKPYIYVDYTPPNSAPYAPILKTPVSGTISNNRRPYFSWTHNDPDGGHQSGWQLQWTQDPNFGTIGMDTGPIMSGEWPGDMFWTPSWDVADNIYYWRVRTCDNWGVWGPYSAPFNFGIENTPPTIDIHTPVNGLNTNNRTPDATWTGSDNWSGVSQYFLEIINHAYSASLWNSGWRNGGSGSGNRFTLPDLGDGTFFFRMALKDNAGNLTGPIEATNRVYTVDTVNPIATGGSASPQYVNVPANGTYYLEVTGVSDDRSGVSGVQVATWTRANDQDDIKWRQMSNAGGGKWFINIPINEHGNAEDLYYNHIFVHDYAGNSVLVRIVEVSVDRTPPTIASIDGARYVNVATGNQVVTVYNVSDSSSGVASVTFWWNKTTSGGTTDWVTVPATRSGNNWSANIPLSGVATYNVHARALDRAGHESSTAITTIQVDTTRANDPNPTEIHGTDWVTISWNGFNDPAPSSGFERSQLYLHRWDGSKWINVDGDEWYTDSIRSHTVHNLIPGARYRYTVAHYDRAGNESAFTYKEFVTKRLIHSLGFSTPTGEITFPIYALDSGVSMNNLQIRTPAGTGCYDLLPLNDSRASKLQVMTPLGIRAVEKH